MVASKAGFGFYVVIILFLLDENNAKLLENKTNGVTPEKIMTKMNGGAPLLFVDELKQTLERYLFGMCPQNFKIALGNKAKNITTPTCDLDTEQHDLAGRLASIALHAHAASRGDCSRLGIALANTFGELARTAASRQVGAGAGNEAIKKRKLSKSQKAKIAAKQRTALAVKKKAAALAAAAAAKMAMATATAA